MAVLFDRLNTALAANERNWTFVGTPGWKQSAEGLIYPPTWSLPAFDEDPHGVPNLYAHELAREDYAFLSSQALADTDISVEHKCPYGSVIHGGVIFRAMDTCRFYVVDIVDMGRKAQDYELTLWRQDAAGYRKVIARGRASHSIVPERIVQMGPQTREEWEHSSPDWVTVRVQASGTFIRVSLDGRIVFEARDRTWPAGCAGLVARGSVLFRNLKVVGLAAELPKPWTEHQGEPPWFFYPGGKESQGAGFNAYPAVGHTGDGTTLMTWWHHPPGRKSAGTAVVLTRSEDEGRTWTPPRRIFSREGCHCGCSSIFEHKNGAVSCLISVTPVAGHEGAVPQTYVIRSPDRGLSWPAADELAIAGRPLSVYRERHGRFSFYSPWVRLSDGAVVMCAYEHQTVPGGNAGCNADRLDRSLLIRSLDDGFTWEEPIHFDPTNFDHNECMIAETAPGRLVAFMRTLAAPCMWTSTSEDGGKTWSRLVQSSVSAECPSLLRHSSGALILASRGYGTFVRLSFDGGKSWTPECRISPASAMIGMTEMKDGRVLIAMHEGYRVPGYIRGQWFCVSPDGPVAVEDL
ncbi:MAG: exo-alpha-sialidase [Planctomycetes bacterium]|nr:exo-alpha-sialidase [Planctomycetota bacterium]